MLNISFTRDVYNTVIADIVQERGSIPRIPSHVIMIDRCARDESKSVKDMVRLIEAEPSLIARVMQVANSPFYGAINKVTNINLAVSRLGMRTVRNIIMVLAVRDVFRSSNDYINKKLHTIWENSVNVAAIAVVIAKNLNRDLDTALLSGMLHDVGSLAVAGYCMSHSRTTPEDFPVLMEDMAPLLNCSLGSAVLTEWKFPAEIINVIEQQCDVEEIDKASGQIVDVIVLAKEFIRVQQGQISEADFDSLISVKRNKKTFRWILELTEEFEETINEIKQPFV